MVIARTMGLPTILGIPFDGESSYLRGAAEAPMKIREAMKSDAANQWTELGADIGTGGAFGDGGDLEFAVSSRPGRSNISQERRNVGQTSDTGSSTEVYFAAIERKISSLIEEGYRPVSLGGDHSITYPVVKAFAKKYRELTIIHFDAHPDLYDEFEGSRLSHACPFARIMESGLAKRLVQVGIRTATGHQREQARRFGVQMVEMRTLPAYDDLRASGPVYLSFDMDVLDPAFAPGVSHREPGGMTVREAIAHLHAIEGPIVGADLVEYNPVQDVAGMTAIVAAKIVKEIVGKMIVSHAPMPSG